MGFACGSAQTNLHQLQTHRVQSCDKGSKRNLGKDGIRRKKVCNKGVYVYIQVVNI